MEYTLIIHGYSDCSESFRNLKEFLVNSNIGGVETILYVDYESREDELTLNDVVDGLNEQLVTRGYIKPDGSSDHTFNVIVHSTGGLVIRHWLACYYGKKGKIKNCPVKRVVMLAPANFGSPLAHRGKSFLGSLVKGRWKVGDFLEVGRNILDSLELASPFQWELAHCDLLIASPWYNRNQIQLTILVGAKDYEGLRGLVNAPGTDGTVVIAGTCINSAKVCLDFSLPSEESVKKYRPFKWSRQDPLSDFAFAVLPSFDHGSIVGDISPAAPNQVAELLLRAITLPDADSFGAFKKELDAMCAKTYEDTKLPVYQQFIVHAIDDLDTPIKDFNLEFHLLRQERVAGFLVVPPDSERISDEEESFSARLQTLMGSDFHTNGKDPSFRRFLINIDAIHALLAEAKEALGGGVAITTRIYVPEVEKGIRYHTENLQNVLLYSTEAKNDLSFLFPNTTTLIEMRVDRYNKYVSIGQNPVQH